MKIKLVNGGCCLRFRCKNINKKCCNPFPSSNQDYVKCDDYEDDYKEKRWKTFKIVKRNERWYNIKTNESLKDVQSKLLKGWKAIEIK